MKRFVEGLNRGQGTLFPEVPDDFVEGNNPVRVIEAFVEALDLGGLGFGGVAPKATGRPPDRDPRGDQSGQRSLSTLAYGAGNEGHARGR